MPVELTIDRQNELVVTRYHGEFSNADLKIAHDELLEATEVGPGWRQLIDLRDVIGGSVTKEGIQGIASLEPFFSSSARRAIVAPPSVTFGMARMYELLRNEEAGEIRVFRSFSEAARWLGLPAG